MSEPGEGRNGCSVTSGWLCTGFTLLLWQKYSAVYTVHSVMWKPCCCLCCWSETEPASDNIISSTGMSTLTLAIVPGDLCGHTDDWVRGKSSESLPSSAFYSTPIVRPTQCLMAVALTHHPAWITDRTLQNGRLVWAPGFLCARLWDWFWFTISFESIVKEPMYMISHCIFFIRCSDRECFGI